MRGDQQPVTGVALLKVAFARITSITQYHYSIASSLALLAYIAHVSTLDLVVDDLRTRPYRCTCRAIGTSVFALALLVSIFPAISQHWQDNLSLPVFCVWRKSGREFGWLYFISEGTAAEKKLTLPLYERVRRRYIDGLNGSKYWISWFIDVLGDLLFALTVFAHALGELVLSSILVLVNNYGLIFMTSARILALRIPASHSGRIGNENAWGFGQASCLFSC